MTGQFVEVQSEPRKSQYKRMSNLVKYYIDCINVIRYFNSKYLLKFYSYNKNI